YKNGKSGMFVTKYTPTAYWLDNKDSAYQGDIQSRRMNTLEEYTDPEDIFDEELWGDNNYGVGAGVGGSYSAAYSADYPTDCFGTVVVSWETITYLCQCTTPGHLPGQCVDCENPGYYDYVARYQCVDDGYYGSNPPDDTG